MTDKEKNDVPAFSQVSDTAHVRMYGDGRGTRILFLGNSITLHSPAPQLGWQGDWGMAASCAQNDYVHGVLRLAKEAFGKVTGCVCQISEWERNFDADALPAYFEEARAFCPHVTVVRLGDNIVPQSAGEVLQRKFTEMVRYVANGSAVVVTDSFWRSPPVDTVLQAAAQQSGWRFVSIGDLGDLPQMKALGQYKSEGVCLHPSDEGMAEIARRIFDAIAILISK